MATTKRDQIFRYVALDDIDAALALGWSFDCWLGPHSCLMEWLCNCEPRWIR